MSQKINTLLVTGLVVREKTYDVTDEQLSGFGIRVNPSGIKSFWVRYTLPDGQRARMVLGRAGIVSVAQARAEAKRILGQAALGINPKVPKFTKDSSIPTLKEFIEEHYQSWSETHHQCSKPQIRSLYRMKEFLDVPLNEIKVQDVEKWRAKCLKRKLTPATVNRGTAILRSALSRAVDWEIIDIHPLSRLKQLKEDKSPNIRYLSSDEEYRLRITLDEREAKIREDRIKGNQWRAERGYDLYPSLDNAPFVDHLKPLVLLSLNTGARRGELFRMYWEDINFDRKNITLVMRGKRKSHTRHIPMNKESFEILSAWRSMRPQTDKFVFPSKEGGTLDNIQTSWDNLRKDAQINNFRWHDMRHHFASRLVMNGVPLNTVRELLGHTNLEMTLRYAHLAPEQKENAVATLDR